MLIKCIKKLIFPSLLCSLSLLTLCVGAEGGFSRSEIWDLNSWDPGVRPGWTTWSLVACFPCRWMAAQSQAGLVRCTIHGVLRPCTSYLTPVFSILLLHRTFGLQSLSVNSCTQSPVAPSTQNHYLKLRYMCDRQGRHSVKRAIAYLEWGRTWPSVASLITPLTRTHTELDFSVLTAALECEGGPRPWDGISELSIRLNGVYLSPS